MNVEDKLSQLSPEQKEAFYNKLRAKKSSEKKEELYFEADRENLNEPFELIEIQEVYWTGGKNVYDLGANPSNIYIEFAIDNVIGIAKNILKKRLETTINKLVQRHEILRLIILDDGRQQILDEVPEYQLEFYDLRNEDEDDIQSKIDDIRERFRKSDIDKNHWPMFSVAITQVSARQMNLHIKLSALLMDGTSMIRFMGEFFRLSVNPRTDLGGTAFTYRDYAVARKKIQQSSVYIREKNRWMKEIPQLPFGALMPMKKPISPSVQYNFTFKDVELLKENGWNRLNEVAQNHKVSAFAIMLGLFCEAISNWTYHAKYSMGVINTYRPPINEEIKDVIGNFNTVDVIVIDMLGGTFLEIVQDIQRQVLERLQRPNFSGFEVIREYNKTKNRTSFPMLPICFNSTTNLTETADTGDPPRGLMEKIMPSFDMKEANIYPSQMTLSPTLYLDNDNNLRCKWAGCRELFFENSMDDALDIYTQKLRNILIDDAYWESRWKPENAGESEEKISGADFGIKFEDGRLGLVSGADQKQISALKYINGHGLNKEQDQAIVNMTCSAIKLGIKKGDSVFLDSQISNNKKLISLVFMLLGVNLSQVDLRQFNDQNGLKGDPKVIIVESVNSADANNPGLYVDVKQFVFTKYSLKSQDEIINGDKRNSSPGDGFTLSSLFLREAVRNRNKPAVILKNETITYDKLLRMTLGLMIAFVKNGVKAKDLVAVDIKIGHMAIPVFLALIFIGADIAPMDFSKYLNNVSQKTEIKIAVNGDYEFRLKSSSILTIHIDELLSGSLDIPNNWRSFINENSASNIRYYRYDDGDLEYNIISEAEFQREILDFCKRHSINGSDRFFLCATPDYASWLIDIWSSALSGASVLIVDNDDSVNFTKALYQSTIWDQKSYRLELLDDIKALGGLRLMVVDNPKINHKFLEMIYEYYPRIKIEHLWRPFKGSLWVYRDEVTPHKREKIYSYSRKSEIVDSVILNEGLFKCRKWAIGHIYVGFGDNKIKTKQLARYVDEDKVEIFSGNTEIEAKLASMNMSLYDIERACENLESVCMAKAYVEKDESLAVCVLCWNGEVMSQSDAKQALRKSLPYFAMPFNVYLRDDYLITEDEELDLDSFKNSVESEKRSPLELSEVEIGKRISYLKLRAKDQKEYGIQEKISAWQEILYLKKRERFLINILKDILKATEIKRTDNFFDLGGTSVQVVEFLERLKNEYGYHPVTPSRFFEDPTVESLAKCL